MSAAETDDSNVSTNLQRLFSKSKSLAEALRSTGAISATKRVLWKRTSQKRHEKEIIRHVVVDFASPTRANLPQMFQEGLDILNDQGRVWERAVYGYEIAPITVNKEPIRLSLNPHKLTAHLQTPDPTGNYDPTDRTACRVLATGLAHELRLLPLEYNTKIELIAEHRLPALLKSYSERLDTPSLATLVSDKAEEIAALVERKILLDAKEQEDGASIQLQPKHMVSAATSKWLSDIPVRDLARTSSATKTASNDLNDAPECSRYEDILVRSPAFKWLCASILKELTLQRGPFRSFSNTIQEALDSNELEWIIRFRFQWDLAGFLTHEYGDKDQTLGEVITITGTPDNAQAVTCSTYLHQVWPCVGPEILCAIQDAFRRHGESQGVTEVCDLHLLYGKTRPTKFTAQFQPNTSAFWFDVKGTKEAISEAVEVVAWIVGALRSSDHDTGIFIRPEIGKITYDTDGMKALHIKYARLTPLSNEQGQMAHSPILQNGRCWQAMFRNPVVVSEFPIPRRPRSLEHSGLEISFDMMASLVQAPRLTEYAGRQYLKGFSSMLVAVKKTDGIVLWHHYYNPSGGRVSYSDAASRERPDCQHISIEDILAARHIIGWCNHAQFRAGDPAIACGSIKPSGLPLPSRKVLLEKITLSAGSTVTAGVSFAIGEKDKPIHISRDSYLLKLKWVHQKSVVLWDVADKRGWLLNGIDALFHLLRNSLESCRTDKFNSLFLFDFSMFKIYTEANKVSAILTLGDHNNRKLAMYVRDENPHTSYITLQDKVEELIGTLERMFDHQSEVRTSKGINANVRLRRRLQGWDFCDLVLGRDLDLREASLTMDAFSWVDFVKEIGAVTLLGKGFGELIVPALGSKPCFLSELGRHPKGKVLPLRRRGRHTSHRWGPFF
ncbi:hypothetical protein QBC45DRAFT_183422 [Copromyces sp. CBS 386.78]|nr:hypothetical protein QBC45DRAFT_183422 [Copromyces sp. CBS 386.78]